MNNNEIIALLFSGIGVVVMILLAIIAFFSKSAFEEQKKINGSNSLDHAEMKERLARGDVRLEKVDDHEAQIGELKEKHLEHDHLLKDHDNRIKKFE